MSLKLRLRNGVLYTEIDEVVTLLNEEPILEDEMIAESRESVDFKANSFLDPKCETKPGTNIHNNECNDKEEEQKRLTEWLEECGLLKVLPHLKNAQVTFENFQYLDKDDIKEAIPAIGLRAKFRNKLIAWKKKEFDIEDDADSLNGEIRRSMQPAPT